MQEITREKITLEEDILKLLKLLLSVTSKGEIISNFIVFNNVSSIDIIEHS